MSRLNLHEFTQGLVIATIAFAVLLMCFFCSSCGAPMKPKAVLPAAAQAPSEPTPEGECSTIEDFGDEPYDLTKPCAFRSTLKA